MEDQNIVITSLHSWESNEGKPTRAIAQEFSKKNNVLFVNPPLDRLTKFRQRNELWVQKRNAMRRGDMESIQKVSNTLRIYSPPSVIESIGQVNSESVFDALNRINNRRFSRDIREGGDSICFREFALFCDSDIYNSFYLKEYLNPTLTVYYSHDDPKVKELWKHHGGRLEPILMSQSNLVICATPALTEQARIYNENSYLIKEENDYSISEQVGMVAEDRVEFEKDVTIEKNVASIYKVIDHYQL